MFLYFLLKYLLFCRLLPFLRFVLYAEIAVSGVRFQQDHVRHSVHHSFFMKP